MRAIALAVLVATTLSCGGGSAVDQSTEPAIYPVPSITAVVPAATATTVGNSQVTLRGTGFTHASVAEVSGVQQPVKYVSASELTLTIGSSLLANTGLLPIRVFNPAPGGGWSPSASLSVENPLPSVATVSPASVEAGTLSPTVQVTGANFVKASTVQAGGVSRATTFISDTQLSAVLSADDVKQPATLSIRVTSPQPGGGSSATARTIDVIVVAPVLGRLPVSGATSGRGAFALAVDGSHFSPTSVVTWNGTDRPTTFIAPSRITATIGPADVALPSTAQIGVRTPGTSSSSQLPLTVRALPLAVVTSSREIALPVQDAVYDSRTARIYATVSSGGGTYSNSIIAVDPLTGTIAKSLTLGATPGRIVISDDGAYLYALIGIDTIVQRVVVASLTTDIQIRPGGYVRDLAVMPGAPHTIAVSHFIFGGGIVTIFDDERFRAQSSSDNDVATSLAFGTDGSTIYTFNNVTTGSEFRTYAVSPTGVSLRKTTPAVIETFDPYFVFSNGRIYSMRGVVADPELHTRIGRLTLAGPVVADPALGRVFVVAGDIVVHDINSLQQLAAAHVSNTQPPTFGIPSRPFRWGPDGIAYANGNALVIARTPLVTP